MKSIATLAMNASHCISIALVLIWGAARQTHATFSNGLHCHRLVPSAAIYSFNPCRYHCLIGNLEGPYKIVMQPEADGTLCGYVGRCSGGTCLYNGNMVLVPSKWDTIFERKGYQNGNDVIRDNYGTDTPVTGSGSFAIRRFLAERNSIGYASKVNKYIGGDYAASPYYDKKGTVNALPQLFRVKRSPRLHNAYNRRRRNRNGRRTGGSMRRGEQFHSHGSISRGQSGTYYPPPAPPIPAVIIINQEQKKRGRGLSRFGTAALGVAAGAAAGAGTAAAVRHLSGSKEKELPTTTRKREQTEIKERNKNDGKETENEQKSEMATTKKGEENGQSEKKKSSETDGKRETGSTDNVSTENAENKRTVTGVTGRGASGEAGRENKAEGSNSKELKEAAGNHTEDGAENSNVKQREENESEADKRGDRAVIDDKWKSGGDAVEKAKTGEEGHTENRSGKNERNEGAGPNSTKNSDDNKTDQEEGVVPPKKEKKRRGLFKKLLRKIFL